MVGRDLVSVSLLPSGMDIDAWKLEALEAILWVMSGPRRSCQAPRSRPSRPKLRSEIRFAASSAKLGSFEVAHDKWLSISGIAHGHPVLSASPVLGAVRKVVNHICVTLSQKRLRCLLCELFPVWVGRGRMLEDEAAVDAQAS